jgi:hypothetical protein
VSHAVVALAPILLVSAAVNADQTPEQAFLAAAASFGKGDYAAAERQFAACRRAVGDHPTVDFNLAMTYLRLEQPGRARVYLERVLKQSPRDREARDELRHVLAGLDQPPPPSPSGLHAMWHGLKANVTRRGAVNVAAILFTLAAFLVGGWLLNSKRLLGWIGLAACAGAVAAWCLAGAKLAEESGGQRAIVVSDSATLRAGPGEQFAETGRLSEGTAVSLLAPPRLRFGPGLAIRLTRDSQGLWREVRAPSGARGYVRRSLVDPV